jgi:hypothetical protein
MRIFQKREDQPKKVESPKLPTGDLTVVLPEVKEWEVKTTILPREKDLWERRNSIGQFESEASFEISITCRTKSLWSYEWTALQKKQAGIDTSGEEDLPEINRTEADWLDELVFLRIESSNLKSHHWDTRSSNGIIGHGLRHSKNLDEGEQVYHDIFVRLDDREIFYILEAMKYRSYHEEGARNFMSRRILQKKAQYSGGEWYDVDNESYWDDIPKLKNMTIWIEDIDEHGYQVGGLGI